MSIRGNKKVRIAVIIVLLLMAIAFFVMVEPA